MQTSEIRRPLLQEASHAEVIGIEKEKFFVEYSDVPMKNDETALRHFVKQMRLHVLKPLNLSLIHILCCRSV